MSTSALSRKRPAVNQSKRNTRTTQNRKLPPYKNSKLPVEKRAKDLLARMTLDEKAAQMMCVWQEKAAKLVDDKGNFDPAKAIASFRKGHGLGQVGRPSDA